MKKLIAIMAGNVVFAYLAFILLLIGGIFSALHMTREVMPSFSVDVIQAQVIYPGATPEEVEEGICLRFEEAIEGVEGVKKSDTVAQEGVGLAFITVEEDYDASKVKEEFRDRITAISTFPVEAEKPIVSEITTRSDVLCLALCGDLPESQLKEEAEKIKEELRRIPTISQVGVSGVRDYEISIEVSEDRLRKYGLTLSEVALKIQRACLNIPGGSVFTRGEEFKIRTMGRRYRGEEFRNIVIVSKPDGTVINLDKIADIKDSFEEEPVFGFFNGKKAALITILKTDEEDALAIAKDVADYAQNKQKTLPPGLKLTAWSDFSKLIQDRIDLLVNNGRLGFLLVFCSLWFFLGLRLGFWVAMGIPVSLAGALVIMMATGQTINLISLFALIMTLGIIVDDAIVVGEAIYVHRLAGKGPFKAAVDGVLEVFWPIVGAVSTTIVAFLPLCFVSGIMGKFIAVLPMAVISALFISLFECFFLMPAHLNHLPDPNQDVSKLSWWKRITFKIRRLIEGMEHWVINRLYAPFVQFALKWRYVALALSIAVMMITIGLFKGGIVKYVMFPEADTDFLITRIEFPTGTPIEVTQKALDRIEKGLKAVEAKTPTESGDKLVRHVYSMIGSLSGYNIEKGSHLAEVKVELLPSELRGVFYKDINAEWEKEIGPIEGALSLTFQTVEHGPPGLPIDIWFLGENYQDLLAAADLLKQKLQTLKGVYEIEDDYRPGKTELRVKLKPAAQTLGLTLSHLGLQMRHGWHGDEPVRIQRGRDDIRIKVRYPELERNSLADLERIRIRTPSGAEVPFHSVAELSFEKGLTTINRHEGTRKVGVTANVNSALGANAEEILADLELTFLPTMLENLPGVIYSVEGQKKESGESILSLFKGFAFAMFGIFLILATIFKSYWQPAIIMITVPFGFIGAIVGHMILGLDLTMMTLFGLVALTGIVVNDAIVLIESVNTRIKDGMPFFEALVQGGKRRFRAIILTTITTSVGLLPIIVERSVQAQYVIPMAVTISFGVFVASFLTLVIVPCLMGILNDCRLGLYFLWNLKTTTRESLEPGIKRRETEKSIESI